MKKAKTAPSLTRRIGCRIDRALSIFSPRWAAQRLSARATLDQIESFGAGPGGYEAGKLNRLNRLQTRAMNENAVPRGQLERLRAMSWNLYRNNEHARKIVNSLLAKVIGRGPKPLSLATSADGTANVEFRQRARELWDAVQDCLDYRGRPGQGGQDFAGMARLALRTAILSGELIDRPRAITTAAQRRLALPLPLLVQLIHPERIAENYSIAEVGVPSPNRIFRGVEVDPEGRTVAFWVLPYHPSDPLNIDNAQVAKRIPAEQVGHLFVQDDIDQLRGVPWFAPILMKSRDTGDYEYNELKASAVSSCVTLGVRRPNGATSFGLAAPSDWDLTDNDGNPITAMQPGMIVDLGENGELDGFNPNRPNVNASEWIQHMLRSQSAGVPGVKASTLTGDYRGSSFSSERAADNDAWPEIEAVQDWFHGSFTQPIYEAVITSGVETGWFDPIGLTAQEFIARRHALLRCKWQGPVARAINPGDDAKAAILRIQAGISSVQIEAQAIGYDWREIQKDSQEFKAFCLTLGIDEALIDQFLGMNPQVKVAETAAETAQNISANGTSDAGALQKND